MALDVGGGRARRRRHRAPARPGRGRRRGRHPPRGQRAHGRPDPPGHDQARLRPAPVRAGGAGRRRARCTAPRSPRRWAWPRCSCRRRPACSPPSACSPRRSSTTTRARCQARTDVADLERRQPLPGRAGRRRARRGCARRACPRTRCAWPTRPTCATSGRPTSWRCRSPRPSRASACRRSWPRSTPCTSACTATRASQQPVEFVNFRAVHTYPLPRPVVTPGGAARAGTLADARLGERRAYFRPTASSPTAVYERARLPLGARVAGPGHRRADRHHHRDPARRTGPASTTPATCASGEGMMAIDPILLEVLRNRLDAIADEMELTLLKSAASPDREGRPRRLGRALQHRRARPSPRPRPSRSTWARSSSRRSASCARSRPRAHAGRRRVPAERPLRRRHPSARHHAGGAGVRRRPRGGAGVHDVPPPGRGRPHAGQRADRRHRALPGGRDHPAHPALPRRRAGREPLPPAHAQRAAARRVHRRPHGPGGGGTARRRAPARAVRRARRRDRARVHRRAARRGPSGSRARRSRPSPTATTPSRTGSTTTAWTSGSA